VHAKDGPKLERVRVYRPRTSISNPNLKKVTSKGEGVPQGAAPVRPG